jgi:hypothetical protein
MKSHGDACSSQPGMLGAARKSESAGAAGRAIRPRSVQSGASEKIVQGMAEEVSDCVKFLSPDAHAVRKVAFDCQCPILDALTPTTGLADCGWSKPQRQPSPAALRAVLGRRAGAGLRQWTRFGHSTSMTAATAGTDPKRSPILEALPGVK